LVLVLLIAVSLAPVSAAAIKVACIGDSITAGYGNGVTTPYPAVLQNLPGSGYTVNNYGVSGTTLLKRGDNPYRNTWQYTDSSNWLPNIVVIMLGSNDSKSYNWQYESEFVPNYEELINHYKSLSSHPVVYVATSPTVYNGTTGNFGITNQVVTGQVVPLTRQAANETGCTIIDVNTATLGMPLNFPDYVHPNDAGYLVIAKTIFNVISVGAPTPTPTTKPTPTRRTTPTPTRQGSTATPTRRTSTPTPTTRSTTPNSISGGYAVTYVIQSDWGSGATVSVSLKNNTSATINGWTLAYTFPGAQTITNLWNGIYTQSGASVSVKDAGYNANIPANGGIVNFGFNINYSGTNAKPTSFFLNGTACQVSYRFSFLKPISGNVYEPHPGNLSLNH
jgi:lysophospholipase L1-like esterase